MLDSSDSLARLYSAARRLPYHTIQREEELLPYHKSYNDSMPVHYCQQMSCSYLAAALRVRCCWACGASGRANAHRASGDAEPSEAYMLHETHTLAL
eukprot:2020538-Pleurochrysis_carterae.AAC.1